MKNKFVFLEHTADVEFGAFGGTLEEVFKNSALALQATLTQEKVLKKNMKKIHVRGSDKESLLANFLNELIFLFDSEQFLIGDIKRLKIVERKEGYILDADVAGDSSEKYVIKLYVKAATYHEMKIVFDVQKKLWRAKVVLDV